MRTLTLEVKISKEKGRGLFAVKKLAKGDVIEFSPTIPVPREASQKSGLKDYVFYHPIQKNQTLIALGYGSLFNHSRKPNVDWIMSEAFGQPAILFTAKKKIDKGEELTIDYGYTLRSFKE